MPTAYLPVLIVILCLCQCTSTSIDTDSEISSSSKKEREINGWMQYEYELTHDPETQSIPRERLLPAIRELQSRKEKAITTRTLDQTWTSIGPLNVGGRTRAIIVDQRDETGNTVWAGSVSGGLWKTTSFFDTLVNWQPVEGLAPTFAIGSMIQSNTNPSIFFVGTGEGWFNGDAVRGTGIWQSTDGGESWNQLPSTNNSTFRFVQDLIMDSNGHIYAATRNGGVQKSTDGGMTWRQVLGNSTGNADTDRAADLELAADGDLYATMGVFSIGTVHKSDIQSNPSTLGDIETWQDITPAGDFRRIELATAATDADRLYILCEDEESRDVSDLFRSDDAGMTWDSLPVPTIVDQGDSSVFTRKQAWYDLIAAVDPNDADKIYIGGIDLLRSDDKGETWQQISTWSTFRAPNSIDEVHADQHQVLFVNGQSEQAIVTNDGGIYYSGNFSTSQPIFSAKDDGYNTTQFYSCCIWPDVDDDFFMGGSQDNGTWAIDDRGTDPTQAFSFYGGDGGYCYLSDDVIAVSQQRINIAISVADSEFNLFALSDRGDFINPFTIDDKRNILYGAFEANQYFVATDPGNQAELDSVFIEAFDDGWISALTVDPSVDGRLWVGVKRKDGGGACSLFAIDSADSSNPVARDMSNPDWSQNWNIRNIEFSPDDPSRMLVTISNFGAESVWTSVDGGDNWTSLEGNLPDIPIFWGIFNPINPSEIILATELGVMHSLLIDGDNTIWEPYKIGIPTLRTTMLKVRKEDNLLLASSYGRGLYITQLLASEESILVSSFASDEVVVNEEEGETIALADCAEPIHEFQVPISLNRLLRTEEEDVFLEIRAPETTDYASDLLIPSDPIPVPRDVISFTVALGVIDDGQSEQEESYPLELVLISGEASIGKSTMNVSVRDNEFGFISLPAETELSTESHRLVENGFTHFISSQDSSGSISTMEKAMARINITTIDGMADLCAKVSIDRNGSNCDPPSWLNGYVIHDKTFFISSDQAGPYAIELYFSPDEFCEFLEDQFDDLSLINSGGSIGAVNGLSEVSLVEDATFQKLNDNLYRVKTTVNQLGGFAVTNAPDLTSVSTTNQELETIKLFPNPTSGYVLIDGVTKNITSVSIHNIYGQIISTQPFSSRIDLGTLTPGVYYLGFLDSEKRTVQTKSIIVQ